MGPTSGSAVRSWAALLLAASLLAACGTDRLDQSSAVSPTAPSFVTAAVSATTASQVRLLAAGRGVVPLATPAPVRPELVRLGRALTFDRILSGNRNISCATCHLPTFATGDGRSLSIGEGGAGMGPGRTHPQNVFIARNAPPLFNLGAMKHLFWDGRVQAVGTGVSTPAGALLTPAMSSVFEFGPASALAMFPVTNRAEMRGQANKNDLADVPDADLQGIWAGLMKRLGAIPEYRRMFEAAYPGTHFDDMTFAHASNAIAGFVVATYSFNDTPWDRFLAGNDNALTQKQLDGAQTFLTLKCSLCHNGSTFSDEQFHNVAVAQVGPGEGDGSALDDDFGRMRVTGDPADRYRFRTTPLRNVELTAPYGHDGAIGSLRGFVEHYSQSDLRLRAFDTRRLDPLLQHSLVRNQEAIIASRDSIILGVVLTPTLIDQLMDYLSALTDDRARNLRATIPSRVPSGLPVDM